MPQASCNRVVSLLLISIVNSTNRRDLKMPFTSSVFEEIGPSPFPVDDIFIFWWLLSLCKICIRLGSRSSFWGLQDKLVEFTLGALKREETKSDRRLVFVIPSATSDKD